MLNIGKIIILKLIIIINIVLYNKNIKYKKSRAVAILEKNKKIKSTRSNSTDTQKCWTKNKQNSL